MYNWWCKKAWGGYNRKNPLADHIFGKNFLNIDLFSNFFEKLNRF